ncbi:ABC transporter ATP-binding protein/permease [Desulforhopalus singaporensis]|nr:ABC transporter ATP-binding protein/permease [Desulforhopalus singaporensis]
MSIQEKEQQVTQKSLLYWAFRGNLKLQLILVVVIFLIVFARVLPLEMQKRIINDSIALKNLRGLVIYCIIYLVAITASGGLKLAINYLQAVIGERAMNQMRKDLYAHIITLPLSFFRTTQPGMVVSSLMTELSTAGTFAGMAFAVPITNILTLLAFAFYLIWLNAQLGVVTLLIYPIIVFVIPVLQKKANRANQKRVDLSRSTSSQIAESISGIHEIQVHGAQKQENDKFRLLADQLKSTRIRWSLLKFGIKTANNYFVSLGPFIIFIFGGYLVMKGQLELGAMVAFLSAQEKLFDPWKELIDFYQTYQDAMIRYRRTMEHFDAAPEFITELPPSPPRPMQGRLQIKNLIYETEDGSRLLNGISFSLEAGEHLAVVGYSGSGKSTLIQCIGKMFPYTAGSITIDDRELADISKKEIINNIGYVSQNPFIFTGTIRENLLYAYQATKENKENPHSDPNEKTRLDRLILVLQQVGLFVDVIRFGLESYIDQSQKVTADKIVQMRTRFQNSFADKLSDSIEFYHRNTYHMNSTVAENIIFGTSSHPKFSYRQLPFRKDFRDYLNETGLHHPLIELGTDLAAQAVDILHGLHNSDLFFEKSPVAADQIEKCQEVLARIKEQTEAEIDISDQIFLLSLALNFIPSVHTMTRLDPELKTDILVARIKFPLWCETKAPGIFQFYNESDYLANQSILNNIVFGKIRPGIPRTQEIVNQSIIQLLIEEDYLEQIAATGLDYQVGTMGDRLSGGQRQKLSIGRVLLKNPKLILLDEATSALDNKSQTRIQRLMNMRWKKRITVVAVVHRLDTIKDFDKVAVTKSGKLVEFGSYQELINNKGMLYELIYGKKDPGPGNAAKP